jgi:hypothetical protein
MAPTVPPLPVAQEDGDSAKVQFSEPGMIRGLRTEARLQGRSTATKSSARSSGAWRSAKSRVEIAGTKRS